MNIFFFAFAGLMILVAIPCLLGALDANQKKNSLRSATSEQLADQWNSANFLKQWEPIHNDFVMNVAFFVLSLIAATIFFVLGLVLS